MSEINMRTVSTILDKARQEISVLHGVEYDDDGRNDPNKRAIARRLNRLADDLMLASALVRNEYWEGRR